MATPWSRERLWWLPLLALSFVAALTPSADGDLWWHLAAGREMLATRAFLTTDPFTLSAFGRAWIDLHWLFQLFVHGIYTVGGLGAVVVAKAAIVATGAGLLMWLCERAAARLEGNAPGTTTSARPLLATLLVAALLAARHLVLVRPVVFTLVFIALFLLVLEDFAAARGNPRRLLWLPVLQIVWVNCQGLFALGPALIACYAAGGALAHLLGVRELPARGLRRLGGVLALTLAACLVTPYGWAGLSLPVELLRRLWPGGDNVFSANIAENVPPWQLARSAPAQMSHLSWALGITAASLLAARKRLHFGRTLVLAAFAGLALIANRNVLLFYWVAAPIATLNLAPTVAALAARLRAALSTRTRASRGAMVALALLPLLTTGGLAAVIQAHETSIFAPAPFRAPQAAVAWLAAQPHDPGRPGRIFAADHYGGFLTWSLHPHHRPFIDTRLVLHTGDEYADFLGLLDHPERFDELQRRQRFDHALLPAAFPDRYLGLIRHLHASPDWRLVHTDGTEVLFAARAPGDTRPALDLTDPAVLDGILAALEPRHPIATEAGRAARRHLGRLLVLAGHLTQAHQVLALLPDDDVAGAALRARAHLLGGALDAAEAITRPLLARAGPQPMVLNLMALIALERGDGAAALDWLRRTLQEDPFDSEAEALLTRLEALKRQEVAGK